MIPVKLPKEVLNLFPAWEHRCPRCSTYVESKRSFCPNCKTPFDEKNWRVPPRFLKSHDAMSTYAHKVLAPKLTPKQRELLFQYFTEYFDDGFEDENDAFTTNWNGKTVYSGDAATIETSVVHHGSQSAKCYICGDGSGQAKIDKILGSSYDVLYLRHYFRWTGTAPTSGKQIQLNSIFDASSNLLARCRYWYSPYGISFNYRKNGGYTDSYSYVMPTENTWYCLEFYIKRHATLGAMEFWIDGVSKGSDSGFNNADVGSMDRFSVGVPLATAINPITIYADCVVVADTYIGLETEEQTYTKTWTTDALFKKLGIQKTLGVDAAFQKQDTLKTFGINADFLKRDLIKGFTVDARFGALATQTIARQIDVLLKKLDLTKNFGLDAYFGSGEAETYTKNFGLSAIFAYKVRLPELWLDENGKIVLNISKPYTWVGS